MERAHTQACTRELMFPKLLVVLSCVFVYHVFVWSNLVPFILGLLLHIIIMGNCNASKWKYINFISSIIWQALCLYAYAVANSNKFLVVSVSITQAPFSMVYGHSHCDSHWLYATLFLYVDVARKQWMEFQVIFHHVQWCQIKWK